MKFTNILRQSLETDFTGYLTNFFQTFGFHCGIDRNYDATLDRICAAISNSAVGHLFSTISWERPSLSRAEHIVRGTTRVCQIIGMLKPNFQRGKTDVVSHVLMSLPYPEHGVFVFDGLQKILASIPVFHPFVTTVVKPMGIQTEKADAVVEFREGGVGYKVTTAMILNNTVLININSWRQQTKGAKLNIVTRSVDPITFLGCLLVSDTCMDVHTPGHTDYEPASISVSEITSMIKSTSSVAKDISIYIDTILPVDAILSKRQLLDNLNTSLTTDNLQFCFDAIRSHSAYNRQTRLRYAYTVCVMISTLLAWKINHKALTHIEDMSVKRVDTYASCIERSMYWHLSRTKFKGTEHVLGIVNTLNKIGISVTTSFKQGHIRTYFRNESDGFLQNLSVKSHLDILSHTRRLKIPCDSSSTDPYIRQTHAGDYGFICPFETPEGREVGLVRYFASTVLVTDELPKSSFTALIEYLETLLIPAGVSIIFLNGVYLGRVDRSASRIIRNFRTDRAKEYSGLEFISVSVSEYKIHIFTDKGRLTRPLRSKNNVIEFIDQHEQVSVDINIRFKYTDPTATHFEIHGSFAMGLAAAASPLANHSQASRISFQSSMSKQAITCDPMFIKEDHDGTAYLWYGQEDIASTCVSRMLGTHRTTGVNCVVMIASMGFNQEDAIVMNKASVERGLFASSKIKKYRRILHRESDMLIDGSMDDHHQRDDDSIITVGQEVNKGDTLFAFYRADMELGKIDRVEFGDRHPHIVTKVERTNFEDFSGNRQAVTVRLESTNFAQVGDKFASRYSQKGVIGLLAEPWELPYTSNGIIPDIIINPHAIPSRMTVGHLMETAFGRAACLHPTTNIFGKPSDKPDDPLMFDCTAFEIDDMTKFMERCDGNDTWLDPLTGCPIEEEVFAGVCFYQALKHQIVDKSHVRKVGPVSAISHQPVEGRARGGGMRIGEMERDALIAYGCNELISDKFMRETDKFITQVCASCNTIFNVAKGCYKCHNKQLKKVVIPYSFKLVSQSIQAAGIQTTVNIEEYRSARDA